MDIRNVLVPVDFSPASRLAAAFAVQFARNFRARLTFLHVVESTGGLLHSLSIRNDTGRTHDAGSIINGLSEIRPADGDLDVQNRIRTGIIEEEILAAIDDEIASLVVVGTHHRGMIRKLLVGSIIETILRKTPVPLLTVTSDASPKSLKRILFATDLTESSLEGFRFALKLARTLGATLIVHHSVERISLSFGGSALAVEHARRKLSELEMEGGRQQVVVISEVTEGAASEQILATAEQSGAELIVLTIRHKGLLEHALLGSTAERIVRESRVPVLSLPVNEESVGIEAKVYSQASIPSAV